MSNGDPNPIQVIFRDVFGTGKSSALTSKNNEVILKLVKMHILEMEDVLFHLNSAVMMPENPQGESSTQGGGAGEEQIKVSGIKALALVFKQFEFDPDVKMVVSGHTDTSGTAEFNFKLSKERALNILYLIYKEEEEDSRKRWAEVCYNRQKIEDYQQILTYFEKKLACGCDPQGIDDTWRDDTKKATENFLIKMGLGNVKVKSTLYEIETDQKKRWPVSIWELVYDLYSKEIYEVLEITDAELESRRNSSVKFVDDDKKIVSCGESFPIDQKEKSNYRSQKNRRVELLFFDNNEIPELTCPADIKNTHKEEDCPLWRKFYFVPLYIDPADLKAVVFHLQFVYYDKIKEKQLPVPAGWKIKAFENAHKEIPTETIFKKGIYYVKVKFGKTIKDPARTEFYFEIDKENQFVYTADKGSDPVLITKPKADFDALSYLEKRKYYDLPKFWSSRNYWTRYGGDINKGERFEKVFNDTTFADSLKLKPLGDKTTVTDKPMVFSMDDIVLVQSTGSQIITDKNSADAPIPLDDNSRYSLFHIDYETEEDIKGTPKKQMKIKIYKPETDQPVLTDFKFKENIISDVPIYTRVVYFCNGFYDVTNKRSTSKDISFDYTKKHIAGCRIAKLNDSDVHHFQDFETSRASDKTNGYGYNGTFHFELHYFHDCFLLDDKPLQYLFIYWNCRLRPKTVADVPHVADHRREGMTNAMDRLNKNYMIEKTSGSEDIFIRPYHFMEAKSDTNGGAHKHLVDIKSDGSGSWNSTSTAEYRAACYQPEPGGWGGGDTASDSIRDSDGETYIPLANHHEMGHSTGCFDDYLYSLSIDDGTGTNNDRSTFVPRFSPQHIEGGPYSCDEIARMKSNRSSRLRNYWKYIVWLHDMGAAGTPKKPLNHLLKGTRFKIRYPGKKGTTYFDHQFELNDTYKNISLPAFKEENVQLIKHQGSSNERRAKVDLLIYKLADDQLAHFKNPGRQTNGYETSQVYYGILVVKMKFAIKFSGGWNFSRKKRWLQKLNDDAKAMLNAKFYLDCNNNQFKKLYVYFVPHFKEYIGAVPVDSNVNIEVKFEAGTDLTRVNISNITLQRGANGAEQDNQIRRLIRCCLAKRHGVTETATPDKNDFPTIVSWTRTKLGNVSVSMKNI